MPPPRRIARPKLSRGGAAQECRCHGNVDTTVAATQRLGWPIATQVTYLSELELALLLERQSVPWGLSTTELRLGTGFSSGDRYSHYSERQSVRVTARAIPSCTEEELIRDGRRMMRRVVSGRPPIRRALSQGHRVQPRQPCPGSHGRPKQGLQRHQTYRPCQRGLPQTRYPPRRRSNGKTSRGSSNHGEPVRRLICGKVLSLRI
jgi:hypothetical protein